MQIHVAHRDIFTAVAVSRVSENWVEKPRVFFTSLTCSRSLFSDNSPAMWRHVCGPRGGGQHWLTPHVPLPPMSAHPIVPRRYGQSLRLTVSAHCANAPATPHDHRCGACDRHPRSHCCRLYFFIDSNQLLGYYAVRDSLFSQKRENHATTRPGRSGL